MYFCNTIYDILKREMFRLKPKAYCLTWQAASRGKERFSRRGLQRSMFPPAEGLGLEKCMRVLPHDLVQDASLYSMVYGRAERHV